MVKHFLKRRAPLVAVSLFLTAAVVGMAVLVEAQTLPQVTPGPQMGQPPALPAPGITPPAVSPPAISPPAISPPAISPPTITTPAISTPGATNRSSINFQVERATERLEMMLNTSRRLTTDRNIREAQVNNPDLIDLTPMAPNKIMVSAKATGVTQIILFAEDGTTHTIDVIVQGDAQELTHTLKMLFPSAAVKVLPMGGGVLLSGFVDQADDVRAIVEIAEQYYPNVINRIRVNGPQQVLLHVKVMEVSRTKLRQLGIDWTLVSGTDTISSGLGNFIGGGGATFSLNVFNGANQLTLLLDALRDDKLAKILAEPNIVAASGRPAYFHVGGEFGYAVNGGITGPSVEWKQYGTRIDFVAMVLGGGRIRLEVRPMVSERDDANAVSGIPAIRTREVETGVELLAGQTLAIAGLVQERTESQNQGLPWISEVPLLGVPFRRVQSSTNEVELLIMVTPELIDPLDRRDLSHCNLGQRTTQPSDGELFIKGHLEVPNCCPPEGEGGSQYGPARGRPNPTPTPPQEMIIEQRDAAAEPAAGTPDAGTPEPPIAEGSPDGYTSRPRSSAMPYNRYLPAKPRPSETVTAAGGRNVEAGFIGPVGYDVVE